MLCQHHLLVAKYCIMLLSGGPHDPHISGCNIYPLSQAIFPFYRACIIIRSLFKLSAFDKVDSLDGRFFELRWASFSQLLYLLPLSHFGIGPSSTPRYVLHCQNIAESSACVQVNIDTVKSFTVVDEAAVHVILVFNMFITDQPHVHDFGHMFRCLS